MPSNDKHTAKLTSGVITHAIRQSWQGMWWIPQCRVGCGLGQDGERTMDLWGITSKRPYLHVAIEVKTSRSDYFRDLRQPLKQRRARLAANQFFFAAPSGILTAEDLPPWAGLIEVGPDPDAILPIKVATVVPAPWFDSSPPTWSFLAYLVRRFASTREGAANVI